MNYIIYFNILFLFNCVSSEVATSHEEMELSSNQNSTKQDREKMK